MIDGGYLPGDPARLENLPVELRAEDFSLIARATVATAADTIRGIPDDNLYVSVTLPDGGKIGRMIPCRDGEAPQTKQEIEALLAELPSVSAFLHAEASAATQDVDEEVRTGISCTPIDNAPGAAFRGASLYHGAGVDARDPLALPGADRAGLSVVRDKDAPTATVQISPSRGESVNVVLPRGATVTIVADEEDWITVEIVTGVAAADDIIRLRAGGQVDDVAAVLKGQTAGEAAHWLDNKPAAGALLGYGLLRTNAPETMAEAFADAESHWPDDPDALIIAAEIAARLARHDEAMTLFLAAIDCGLPAFSFGLNYAADRLRAYGPREGGPQVPAAMATRLEAALARVYPFANQQETSVLLTCYTGEDPRRPSVAPEQSSA